MLTQRILSQRQLIRDGPFNFNRMGGGGGGYVFFSKNVAEKIF